MGRAPGSLDPLSFLVRVILAVSSEVVGSMTVQLMPVSEDRLLETLTLRVARDTLTLSLRLSHTKFLRNEAVFNHLVDIFFFCERSLVLKVHIAHLLTNVGLMYALWVMTNEAVVGQTLPNESTIDAVSV